MKLSHLAFFAFLPAATLCAEDRPRPLMKDFIGLNTHTLGFKPALYAPVARVVRDYHPMDWDTGKDTSEKLTLPLARNKVDWREVYEPWIKAGYRVHASIMFDNFKVANWKDLPHDSYQYGLDFAKALGPSSKTPLVEAAEIGNEPGSYDDAHYRTIFENMAKGLRAGDPKLKIATCSVSLGKSGKYSKSVDCLTGLDGLWDILNLHIYAEVEGYPTWRRSYPEDPTTKWLPTLEKMIAWRDAHAQGKELWVTEFGYDACSKPNFTSGDFVKWIGNTEEQQAMWLVRSFLLLARHGVDRAHWFYFNDTDEPHVHGSSGLTRNFQPKPAFYAMAWMQHSLGDYRFSRVEREDSGEAYAYEFVHGTDPKKRVWAIWKPVGETKAARFFHDPMEIVKAERMPMTAGAPEKVEVKQEIEGYFAVDAAEKPIFVWLEAKK